MKKQDTYKEVKTFKYPNATVRVHIPDLTEEERERRLNAVKRSTEALLREVLRNEYKGQNKKAKDNATSN